MITINGTFELRNDPKEITLAEWEKIYNQLKDESITPLERYWNVFELMGVPDEIMNKITGEDLVKLIAEWNNITISTETPKRDFVINGRSYVAYDGEEFQFMGRDLVLIEKASMEQKSNYCSYCLALLFKDDQLTSKEHYDEAHIKYKAKLFAQHLSADDVIPYLALIARRVVKSIQADSVE
jgi:hypothetical protein